MHTVEYLGFLNLNIDLFSLAQWKHLREHNCLEKSAYAHANVWNVIGEGDFNSNCVLFLLYSSADEQFRWNTQGKFILFYDLHNFAARLFLFWRENAFITRVN